MAGAELPHGYTAVGAFDDAAALERAKAELLAAGLHVASVPVQGVEADAPLADEGGQQEHRRATVFGGAFVGAIAGWLLALGLSAGRDLPLSDSLGIVLAVAVGTLLGAAGGWLLGAPLAARRAPAVVVLLQVGAVDDREARELRARLARDGASRTWSYRTPEDGEAAHPVGQ